MQLRTRSTEPDDVQFLPEIERSAGELFRSREDLAWIADDAVMSEAAHLRLVAAGTSWVALRGNVQVGFVCGEVFGSELHVWELAVSRAAQGQGAGRLLMLRAMDYAAQFHMTAVTLTTFADVPWNAPFYARLGFAVLEPAQWSARLRQCLEDEAEAGLAMESRCAMCWRVSHKRS